MATEDFLLFVPHPDGTGQDRAISTLRLDRRGAQGPEGSVASLRPGPQLWEAGLLTGAPVGLLVALSLVSAKQMTLGATVPLSDDITPPRGLPLPS